MEIPLFNVPLKSRYYYYIQGIYRNIEYVGGKPLGRGLVTTFVAKTPAPNYIVYGYAVNIGDDEWLARFGIVGALKEYEKEYSTVLNDINLKLRAPKTSVAKFIKNGVAWICAIIRARYPTLATAKPIAMIRNKELWRSIYDRIAKLSKGFDVEILESRPKIIEELVSKLKAT